MRSVLDLALMPCHCYDFKGGLVFVGNLLLSLLIVVCFFFYGDWLRKILSGSRGQDPVTRFVLSCWSGLLASLILSMNLYHLSHGVAAQSIAWPITVLSGALSLLFAARRAEPRYLRSDFSSVAVLLISTIVILCISSPIIGEFWPSFYYSNNGEFAEYARLADLVKFHGSATSAGFGIPVRSRESVVAILCAIFSRLFGRSTLFVIQPLSYALAWLAMSSIGLLFVSGAKLLDSRMRTRVVFVAVFSLAAFSSGSLQFWSISFVSQYLNTALFFGLLAFLFDANISGNEEWRDSAAKGLTLGAIACAYPEMLLPSFLLLILIHFSKNFSLSSISLRSKLGQLFLAVAVAAIVGNILAKDLIYFYVFMTFKLPAAGWDMYGTNGDFRKIAGCLLGLCNVFWGKSTPSLLTLIPYLVLFCMATLYSFVLVFSKNGMARKQRPLHLAWLASLLGLVAAFLLVKVQARSTNYMAVKLAIAFIWFGYFALAVFVSQIRSSFLKYGTFVVLLVVSVDVLRGAKAFTIGLHSDGRLSSYSEEDMNAARSALRGRSPILVYGDLWNYRVIGSFLAFGQDLFPVAGPIGSGSLNPTIPASVGSTVTFADDLAVLTVGPGHRHIAAPNCASNFDAQYSGSGFTVWKRRSLLQ